MNKTIIVVSLCVLGVFSGLFWVYSKTLQRPADDLVKIRTVDGEKYCLQAGGVWIKSADSHCQKEK